MIRYIPLILLLLLAGCAKPWNTANTALEASAMAVVATDEMLAESPATTEAHAAARARVVAEAQEALDTWEACQQDYSQTDCGERPNVDEFMERYRESEEVQRWENIALALEELREILIVAQAAVGVWRDLEQEPDNWSVICDGLHTTQGAAVRAIEAAGVEVPDQYEVALGQLGAVCNLVTAAVTGD